MEKTFQKYQMKMKKNNVIIYGVLVLVSLFVLCGMLWCTYQYPMEVVKTDTVFSTKTDTLWKDTTIVEKQIIPKIIEKVKTDTVYDSNGDTIQLVTESKSYEKRLISDKDTADLMIYTTGINTSLDSLKMRLKTHREIVTNTIEVTKYVEKKKTAWDKISIGLQGGYGYAFKSKEFSPYVGIGLAVNL